MRRKTYVAALGLPLAALLTGAGFMVPSAFAATAGSGTDTGTSPSAGDDVVVVDCAHQLQVKPDTISLACGDGNDQLVGLDWSGWNADEATATGREVINTCDPSCADGSWQSYPVTVRLVDSKPFADRPERYFTRVIVDGPNGHHEHKLAE
ncbi:hypothetical protein GCM10012275_49870 [Longimycelium tulufanense]|uniref:Secreted protein n=1 Tax=Longimycelium tulufanense TaxID=907463 RepID=A0A8J3CIB2_9PSEU|nr:hypothetical protein [Longimycelium tulufanense]GGM73294.1 hypothetical protein GCM10012275_49870 [Longimycelium tulufanense]